MATTKWSLDPAHSEIQFKVKHLMISTVTGQFNQFNATVETKNEDMSTAKVIFTAAVDSINTNNAQRDQHLKAVDFLDAANHARLTFEGSKMEKMADENYKLHGTLTLKGISRPLVLNVEYGGLVQDPWGNTRIGFTVTGKINRQDFGVSFSSVSETGGVLLGDEVKIHANAEFVKEAELQPA